MLAFVIQNYSHRAGADLGRELVGRLDCHRSTFSGVGASDQPGAVHYRLIATMGCESAAALARRSRADMELSIGLGPPLGIKSVGRSFE
jgi:hypothetical protein